MFEIFERCTVGKEHRETTICYLLPFRLEMDYGQLWERAKSDPSSPSKVHDHKFLIHLHKGKDYFSFFLMFRGVPIHYLGALYDRSLRQASTVFVTTSEKPPWIGQKSV